MVKISIIVPFYNSKKTIRRCIDSVIAQNYDNFELILVDDGSKDGSSSICDEYAKNDERIKLIHKENGGVSSARNAGIKTATGDAIIFIDSDDWIKEGFLAEINDTFDLGDLIIFGMRFHFKEEIIETFPAPEIKTYTENDFFNCQEFYRYKSTISTPCARAFKRSIIQQNNISFDTTLSFAEDSLFNIDYLKYCKKISLNNKWFYEVDKTNEESITHRFLPNQAECRCKYVNAADAFFESEMTEKNYAWFIKEQFVNLIGSITYAFQWFEEKTERMRVIKLISENTFLRTKSTKDLSLKQKIMIFLLRKRCYRLVYSIFNRNVKYNGRNKT